MFQVLESYAQDTRRNTPDVCLACIHQDASTCDFASIKDPQDKALRYRFICSVNSEAVLKALFKVKDDELELARVIKIAIKTENAAKMVKKMVHGTRPNPVYKVAPRYTSKKRKPSPRHASRLVTPVMMKATKHHNIVSRTQNATSVAIKDTFEGMQEKILQMLKTQRCK